MEQGLQIRRLVLDALAPDEVRGRVNGVWSLEVAADYGQLELGEVLTLQEVVQVRRGEGDVVRKKDPLRLSLSGYRARSLYPFHSHRCALRK